MTSGGIRRSQVISPFGPGALTTLVDGSAVLGAGLDHWFASDSPTRVSEFRIDEWRLAHRLRVNHFRLPPDYREPFPGMSSDVTNLKLTIPYLRFPAWSFCPYGNCRRLTRSPLSFQGQVHCSDPVHGKSASRRGPSMSQVPFVILCEDGHMWDFPWVEWVHGSVRPTCAGVLRLRSVGGGSLAGQVVSCDSCKKSRNLDRITGATKDGMNYTSSFISKNLDSSEEFRCEGWRPWLGDAMEPCGNTVRASLRGASNVYFPLVESSIYLPPLGGSDRETIVGLLKRVEISNGLAVLNSIDKLSAANVRGLDSSGVLAPFADDDELMEAVWTLYPQTPTADNTYDMDVVPQTEWRRPEWEKLRETLNHVDLTVEKLDRPYSSSINNAFGRVRLVSALRETRALWGFTRLDSGSLKLVEGKRRLWREQPDSASDWLPAYEVRGEGIYFELREEKIAEWEARKDVQARAKLISDRYRTVAASRVMPPRELSPRFLLMHTLAHILINSLIFECGYSSASLRERLYVDTNESGASMCGALIYTAAGDSEGTLGGLVRMGSPGLFDSVVLEAISQAQWCSTDPLCMEVGEAGQGPDSCNSAACHDCALLPETSCEEFNRFLDRALLIGTLQNPSIGYFAEMIV